MKTILWFCVVLIISSTAKADPKDYYFRKFRMTQLPIQETLGITEFKLKQFIDPENPKMGTFDQRYFVDDEFASGTDAPVLFNLCGEGSCDNGSLDGGIVEHARLSQSYLVSLEHRYYGQSQPFTELTAETLRFLNVENALKDAASFQKFLQNKLALTGPWYVVGGSYAGALSAAYRLKYPDLVVGALASSAPVQARDNFEDFDRFVTLVLGPDCAPLVKRVSEVIEGSINDAKQFAEYKVMFQSQKIEDPIDFLYVVADMAGAAVQYGFQDDFCNALEASKESDLVKTYAAQGTSVFKKLGIEPFLDSFQAVSSTATKDYENGAGMRQWYYQSCTEFGFWQVAYHDPNLSVRSHLLDMAYSRKVCESLFGIKTPPDTNHINETYYYPLLKGGAFHILFTNGSKDPWSQLSISKLPGSGLNFFTIAGGAHCSDLMAGNNDSESLSDAKRLFDKLMIEWKP